MWSSEVECAIVVYVRSARKADRRWITGRGRKQANVKRNEAVLLSGANEKIEHHLAGDGRRRWRRGTTVVPHQEYS